MLLVAACGFAAMAPRAALADVVAPITIHGTVTGPTGAVAGADVDVVNADDVVAGETVTDGAGSYSVAVDPGSYYLRVTPPTAGLVPSRTTVQTYDADAGVDLVLQDIPTFVGAVAVQGRVGAVGGFGRDDFAGWSEYPPRLTTHRLSLGEQMPIVYVHGVKRPAQGRGLRGRPRPAEGVPEQRRWCSAGCP